MLNKPNFVFRTPLRSLALLLVLLISFAALASVLNMYLALEQAVKEVDETIFTLAYADISGPEGTYDWMRQIVRDDKPSLLQTVLDSGMLRAGLKQPAQNLSGYTQDVWPVLSREYDPLDANSQFDQPYNYGLLVMTVEQITQEDHPAFYYPPMDSEDYNLYAATRTFYILTAKIEETLLLNPDFEAPDVMQISTALNTPDGKCVFEQGGRYVIAGQFHGVFPRLVEDITSAPYTDDVRKLGLYIDPEDEPTFHIGSVTRDRFTQTGEDIYDEATGYVYYVEDPAYASFIRLKDTGLEATDEKDITRLDTLLQDMDFNMRSLPVLAADAVEALFPFHQKTAYISEGRGFSGEDISAHNKVVLVPASLAQKNSLKIGDRLHLSLTQEMFSLHNPEGGSGEHMYYLPIGQGYQAPVEADTYTVVGIYNAPMWDVLPRSLMMNCLIVPLSQGKGVHDLSAI